MDGEVYHVLMLIVVSGSWCPSDVMCTKGGIMICLIWGSGDRIYFLAYADCIVLGVLLLKLWKYF